MIIINGVDSLANFTCEISSGKSIVDYIIVSNNIIIPSKNTDNKNSNQLIADQSIYEPKSFKTWMNHSEMIDDHFLITCKFKLKCTLDICTLNSRRNWAKIRHY